MPKAQSRLLRVAACLLVAVPVQLLAATSLADSPAFSLTPRDLQQLSEQQAPGTTSAAVILVDDEHWIFHPDSTIERRQHYIYKILDASAIQSWSSVQDRWEPWHEERPSFRARVITPDGVAHELDPKALVDAAVGSTLPQSYSDVRVLQGPLPAVEVGSVVEAEVRERSTPILGSIAFRGYIARNVPVRFSRFIAEYPETLAFRYTAELCPDLKEVREIRNGTVHLTLIFGAFDPIKETSPLLPFDIPRAAIITMSTGPSWKDVAIRYAKAVDQQIANAAVHDFVATAVEGEKNRSAVIEKLVRAVHREVRYTGVEFGDAAILPAKPAETLARKYGDCKDKAALLVTALRDAGIPSYLALLNAGFEQDVEPARPGMGMFNHAIVYIPGSPELWIDATAEHVRVGSLPPPDEGRLALIIGPDTNRLTRIPESSSSANVTTTAYDYYLPDFGPLHVTESVSGTGVFDGAYRDVSTLLDNQELRKRAESQTQAQWNTEAEIKISHSPVSNFSRAFEITTDIRDTKAITVSETGAAISLPVTSVFSNLPAFFSADEGVSDSKDKPKPRSAGFVLPFALVDKLLYRIHIPAGFALKKIPDDQVVKLGPATYTAHYEIRNQVLIAEVSFDTGKRGYTLEEGNALKKSALEFLKQPLPLLNFAPRGQALLDEGHLREGLDAFRSMAAGQSPEAVNHVRLSRAFLETGCGQEARSEAKTANEIAPKLAVTWRNLAFVHEHDLVGRKYKPGWDPALVETALRKAIELDKDDQSLRAELAESFSYDAAGNQFQSMERLAKAIEVFNAMGDDEVEKQGQQDSMIYDLAVLGNLDQLKTKLDRFGSNGSRAGYRVFLNAVRESGAKAATELQASASGEDLKQAFWNAANLLALTGRYEQEADLAAALGLDSQLFMPAADLRRMHRTQPEALIPDSPENLVRCFRAASFQPGDAKALAQFWSDLAPQPRLRMLLQQEQQFLLASISMRGLNPVVARDIYLSQAKAATESNGNSGFRVRFALAGTSESIFIARENGRFKILGTAGLPDGVARQALRDLDAGNQDAARKWLDWLRQDIKIRSDDDPLGGPVFPHLWNRGDAASAAQIRYAAASLISSKEALTILKEAIASKGASSSKGYFELAYASVCTNVKTWSDCLSVAKSLAAAYPGSDTALAILSQVYAGAGQIQEAEEVLRKAIASSPDDLVLKRVLVNTLAACKRMNDAEKAAKEIAERPNASGMDWNQYGWVALVAGDVNEPEIHAVERAQAQPNPIVQHTIAAMYAEIGNISEARQISLQTLDKFGSRAPDAPWWYVFGRIAEQLGAKSTATLCYRNAENAPLDEHPLSVGSLARKRLVAAHLGSASQDLISVRSSAVGTP